jgi:hypothetical protein
MPKIKTDCRGVREASRRWVVFLRKTFARIEPENRPEDHLWDLTRKADMEKKTMSAL